MSSLFSFAYAYSEPGSKLYFFQTGTTTPQNTYQDADLQVAHAHPVVALSDGRFPKIYLDPAQADYRYILTDGIDPDDDYTLENLLAPITDDYPASQSQSQSYRVKGLAPEIIIHETDASANEGKWRIKSIAGALSISTLDDAEATGEEIISVTRSGSAISVAKFAYVSSGSALIRTGFSGVSPTLGYTYKKTGQVVELTLAGASGTSNDVGFTASTLPAALRPAAAKTFYLPVTDNGTTAMGRVVIGTDGVLTFSTGFAGGAFTNTGTKGVSAATLTYVI